MFFVSRALAEKETDTMAKTYEIKSNATADLSSLHNARGSKTALLRDIRASYPGCICVDCHAGEVNVYRTRRDAAKDRRGGAPDLVIAVVDIADRYADC